MLYYSSLIGDRKAYKQEILMRDSPLLFYFSYCNVLVDEIYKGDRLIWSSFVTLIHCMVHMDTVACYLGSHFDRNVGGHINPYV